MIKDKLTYQINEIKAICLIIFLGITMQLNQSCQTTCGNAAIFDSCDKSAIQKEPLVTYEFENFSFDAPESWSFDTTHINDDVNYILSNDLRSQKDKLEIFTITESNVSASFDFDEAFESFEQKNSLDKNQSVVGLEKFKDSRFEKKAGIYFSGVDHASNESYETMAIWVLKKNTLYCLNASSYDVAMEKENICTSKEIIQSFSIK